MSTSQAALADWRPDWKAQQNIRETLEALPRFLRCSLSPMGDKEDAWCVHGFYTVARLRVFGFDLFPLHRWLQVLCEISPQGEVSYKLFASDFPTVEPGWIGASFDELVARIKSL